MAERGRGKWIIGKRRNSKIKGTEEGGKRKKKRGGGLLPHRSPAHNGQWKRNRRSTRSLWATPISPPGAGTARGPTDRPGFLLRPATVPVKNAEFEETPFAAGVRVFFLFLLPLFPPPPVSPPPPEITRDHQPSRARRAVSGEMHSPVASYTLLATVMYLPSSESSQKWERIASVARSASQLSLSLLLLFQAHAGESAPHCGQVRVVLMSVRCMLVWDSLDVAVVPLLRPLFPVRECGLLVHVLPALCSVPVLALVAMP